MIKGIFSLCKVKASITKKGVDDFHLRCLSESRSRGGSNPSVCPSATLLGCLLCLICNSKRFYSFLFKHCNMGCSHIDDVHLLFCAHFMNIFLICEGRCT